MDCSKYLDTYNQFATLSLLGLGNSHIISVVRYSDIWVRKIRRLIPIPMFTAAWLYFFAQRMCVNEYVFCFFCFHLV